MGLQSKSHKWLSCLLAGAGATMLLVACAGLLAPAQPTIVLSPISGGPGTWVLVTGSGFPATTLVNVRLGPPDVGATPQTYGEGISDASGDLRLAFEMPGQWPDGSPVIEKEIQVVVLNEDGSIKAVAPFSFQPVLAPTRTQVPNP